MRGDNFVLEIKFMDGAIERVQGNERYVKDDVLYVYHHWASASLSAPPELRGAWPINNIRKWTTVER